MSKKTPLFKERQGRWDSNKRTYYQWVNIVPNNSICSCCGASFEGLPHSQESVYDHTPYGKGIVLKAGHEQQKINGKLERQYNLDTVNGPISFIVKHNKEPQNGN